MPFVWPRSFIHHMHPKWPPKSIDHSKFVVIGALMNHNSGCGVPDGTLCEICESVVDVALPALRKQLRPSDSYDEVRAVWPPQILDTDPHAAAVRRALSKHGMGEHYDVDEATNVIVACLYRYGRLAYPEG